MPVPGAGDEVDLQSIRLRGASPIRESFIVVGLVVSLQAGSAQVDSITMKAWEVKTNQWLEGLVSITFVFDGPQPDITIWKAPCDIEAGVGL